MALFVITCLMMAARCGLLSVRHSGHCPAGAEKAEYVRKVALAAMSAGAGSVAYGTLVGMPNALNIAPTTYLGTTTMAGVGISLVCTAFSGGVHRGLPHHAHQPPEEEGRGLRLLYR